MHFLPLNPVTRVRDFYSNHNPVQSLLLLNPKVVQIQIFCRELNSRFPFNSWRIGYTLLSKVAHQVFRGRENQFGGDRDLSASRGKLASVSRKVSDHLSQPHFIADDNSFTIANALLDLHFVLAQRVKECARSDLIDGWVQVRLELELARIRVESQRCKERFHDLGENIGLT
jgi:hypothetical protein